MSTVPALPLALVVSETNMEALDRLTPDTIQALFVDVAYRTAERAKQQWLTIASAMNIRRSGTYLKGIEDADIQVTKTTADADSFTISFEILNTAAHAYLVEDGHAAFHLPSRINWSGPKVKRKKDGTPYLHIPMRHAAYQTEAQLTSSGATYETRRTMMPRSIYEQAKRLTPRQKMNMGPQYDDQGRYLQADLYTKGTALSVSDLSAFIVDRKGRAYENRRSERTVGKDANGRDLVNPAWGSSKFDGMFKTGPRGHTAYMTIRTVTPTSPGWNIPASPGHGVARLTSASLEGGVLEQFMNDDLAQAIDDVLGVSA